MKKFYDKQLNIEWVNYEDFSFKNIRTKKPLSKESKKAYDTIKGWNSSNIKKFIAKEDLKTYSENLLTEWNKDSDTMYQYFAYIDNHLVGTCILSDDGTIEYIIVNPNAQGKGIGTRMIKSITDNFYNLTNSTSENIFAYVHKGNSASKGAFFKSGYQVYYKSALQSSAKNSEFHILYTTPRNKIYTSDEKDL